MSKLIGYGQQFGETENGALTFTSTGNQVLNLFSMGGALRAADTKRIQDLVQNAWNENPKQTIATLLYLRDIRGGQGEKRIFREAIKYLYEYYKFNNKAALFDAIVEVGSWKDIIEIFSVDEYASYVKCVYESCLKNSTTNLMFKWLPSIGGSSNKDAESLAKHLDMTPKQYRKTLAHHRSLLKVVEQKMCANNWREIDYEKLPSRAGFLHGPAFKKHDEERYNAYIEAANKADGSVKMNTGTLYPYEIVRKIVNSCGWYAKTVDNIDQLEATWKNLPDYTDGSNSLVVADTSGSMTSFDGLPMAISCSLAIYFAEHNKGLFHNEFVTFSGRPTFYRFKDGQTLEERVKEMVRLNICDNTDIQKTFDLILKAAVDNKLPEEEMPKRVIIVSDMEFDCATYGGYGRDNMTNLEVIKRKYEEAGYELPQIVFWNVSSHQDNVPCKYNEQGVILVSGASTSTFSMLIEGKVDPYNFMLSVIEKPRYKELADKIIE